MQGRNCHRFESTFVGASKKKAHVRCCPTVRVEAGAPNQAGRSNAGMLHPEGTLVTKVFLDGAVSIVGLFEHL